MLLARFALHSLLACCRTGWRLHVLLEVQPSAPTLLYPFRLSLMRLSPQYTPLPTPPLPSRLYARYFGGDLQIISMEGYGTGGCRVW